MQFQTPSKQVKKNSPMKLSDIKHFSHLVEIKEELPANPRKQYLTPLKHSNANSSFKYLSNENYKLKDKQKINLNISETGQSKYNIHSVHERTTTEKSGSKPYSK